MKETKDTNAQAYMSGFHRDHLSIGVDHTSPLTPNVLHESFNSSILRARDQPIVSMLESIMMILMETIQKKRICNDEYKVNNPNKHYGCRRWDLLGIPCIHALVALGFNKLEPLNYVADYYKVEIYMRTYDNLMGPINGKDMWPSTDNVTLLSLYVKRRRTGRPKKAKRRELDKEPKETSKLGRKRIKMTYTNCGKVGHNKRGCKSKGQGGKYWRRDFNSYRVYGTTL
ncbi:hypothetical protein Vadar_004461 [Vaccinium darrowii]|uniref:Uncharacterized protein n=1 Tax=Vaccinium darrowii TaxID=229202 RepID=A0ACB7XFT4_9ERIC|nr:hypothetical protein Vadar_004461 [Vaccinium darrowii]